MKLRAGAADTVDTLCTKETAFICRSLLNYVIKFWKVVCWTCAPASTSHLPHATRSNVGAL